MVDPVVLRRKYIDETCSLNDYVICAICNKRFKAKHNLPRHFRICQVQNKVTCEWCNIDFTNRGNLFAHMSRVHNNLCLDGGKLSSYPNQAHDKKCTVCDEGFKTNWQLKRHIRRQHFNLKAKTLSCELKKVNQVWFEKVHNTNVVMEIKKASQNMLVMRKLGPNTAIKVHDTEHPVTDLTDLYPTKKPKVKAICDWCNLIFNKRCLKKHIQEKHMKLAKHHCSNCKATFKRHYLYLKHVCFKVRNRRQTCKCPADVTCFCKSAAKTKKVDIRTRLLNGMPFKYKR